MMRIGSLAIALAIGFGVCLVLTTPWNETPVRGDYCTTLGDVNGDDQYNIADPVYLLSDLFGSGDPPVACANGAGSQFTSEEADVLRELAGHLSIEQLDDGQGGTAKTIRFSGVNVQIVNGTDTTLSWNGVGNLIVGYQEPRSPGGPGDPENIRTGSHNIVVGAQHNYSSCGGLIAGWWNSVSAPFASVSGGAGNAASANLASISGGSENVATGEMASVGGGRNNVACQDHQFVAYSPGPNLCEPRFVDNGDGTIYDMQTNLLWQKETAERVEHFQGANHYCQGLELGGRVGWRLPSFSELMSIRNRDGTDPATYDVFVPTTESDWYWVSNFPHVHFLRLVGFDHRYPDMSTPDIDNQFGYVRAVHDGP